MLIHMHIRGCPHRAAGTVGAEPLRRAVVATRLVTVEPSASTRTGLITCISVPLAFKVIRICFTLAY